MSARLMILVPPLVVLSAADAALYLAQRAVSAQVRVLVTQLAVTS